MFIISINKIRLLRRFVHHDWNHQCQSECQRWERSHNNPSLNEVMPKHGPRKEMVWLIISRLKACTLSYHTCAEPNWVKWNRRRPIKYWLLTNMSGHMPNRVDKMWKYVLWWWYIHGKRRLRDGQRLRDKTNRTLSCKCSVCFISPSLPITQACIAIHLVHQLCLPQLISGVFSAWRHATCKLGQGQLLQEFQSLWIENERELGKWWEGGSNLVLDAAKQLWLWAADRCGQLEGKGQTGGFVCVLGQLLPDQGGDCADMNVRMSEGKPRKNLRQHSRRWAWNPHHLLSRWRSHGNLPTGQCASAYSGMSLVFYVQLFQQ